jgi:hypothetical protein
MRPPSLSLNPVDFCYQLGRMATVDMTLHTTVHRIHEGNRAGLQQALERLTRRATKLGVTPPSWTYSDLIITQGNAQPEGWYDLTLTSTPVRLAGWTFVGIIDHTVGEHRSQEFATPGAHGVVLRSAPGETIPAHYRTAENRCDICHSVRRRTETFVVRHTGGEVKQVGRQCLRDCLGTDPQAFANQAMVIRNAEEIVTESSGGGPSQLHYLGRYLLWVACCIRNHGWCSGRHAWEQETPELATAQVALRTMRESDLGRKVEFLPSAEDRELAGAALAYAQGLRNQDTRSDYEQNLAVVAQASCVHSNNLGVAASIIPTYRHHLERESLRCHASATSAHFGTIAKRADYTLTLHGITTLAREDRPTSYLHTFTDAQGNVAKWFGSRRLPTPVGTTIAVRATVKAHDEYRGVKQTRLTRVTPT